MTLLAELELTPDCLDRICVAGQFGKHLKPSSLMGAGLLPPVTEEKLLYAGNTSKTGARLALLSTTERDRACSIAKKVRYIELSVAEGYEKRFTKCMSFS